jgi:hypothetical protein
MFHGYLLQHSVKKKRMRRSFVDNEIENARRLGLLK